MRKVGSLTPSSVASRFAACALVALLGGARVSSADASAAPAVAASDAVPEPHAAPESTDDAALFDALDAAETSSYWDPLEPGNRVIFSFNEFVDRWALGPVSNAYSFVMPDPAERAVRRMFRNLSEPVSFANHLLQIHPEQASQTFARFCLNSSVGIAGIFDVANAIGLPPKPTDFGGTLYRYGVPAGPYLVLPLLGPTTARDTVGDVVDDSAMPQNYLLSAPLRLLLSTGAGITARAGRRSQGRGARHPGVFRR